MSKGYQHIVLAALVWLILAGAAPDKLNPDKQSRDTQQAIAESLKGIDSTLKKPAERDITVEPCEKGSDKRTSDLCAQWYAADAAASSALATWTFGFAGALIAAVTMAAAIKAAIYAKKAADETQRTAEAAEKALEQADKQAATGAQDTAAALAEAKRNADETARLVTASELNAQRELRAYVTQAETRIEFTPKNSPPGAPVDGINLCFIWKNTGKTPALEIRTQVNSMWFATGMPDEFDFADIAIAPSVLRHIGPSCVMETPILSSIDELLLVSQRGERCIWGWIDYDDIYGARHRSEFCVSLKVTGDVQGPGGPVIFLPLRGNFNGMDETCFRKPNPA